MLTRRTLCRALPALLPSYAFGQSQGLEPVLKYEQESGGHIGFYAENTVTGATLTWRPDERFVMCSTVKASLVAFVLTQVDRGHVDLNETVHFSENDIKDFYAPFAKARLPQGVMTLREMCQGAVEVSDNLCCNGLLHRVGGPRALTQFWRSIGDNTSRLDHIEPFLNRTPAGETDDTTTPRAMAENMRHFTLGKVLSSTSRQYFIDLLIHCQTGTKRLRSGFPAQWVSGDKTGSNGKDAAGDIAITWANAHQPLIVCAYTRGGHPTAQQLDDVFAAIGRISVARLIA